MHVHRVHHGRPDNLTQRFTALQLQALGSSPNRLRTAVLCSGTLWYESTATSTSENNFDAKIFAPRWGRNVSEKFAIADVLLPEVQTTVDRVTSGSNGTLRLALHPRFYTDW